MNMMVEIRQLFDGGTLNLAAALSLGLGIGIITGFAMARRIPSRIPSNVGRQSVSLIIALSAS